MLFRSADEQIIKAIPLSTWKRKIVLNPEEYVGNTISEVGIAFGAINTNLVTHSLLKDSEGNSISIVKTDVDVITIYATVFVTFDTSNPNLRYINLPSSNTLVNYLVGGGSAPTGAFSLNDVQLASPVLGSTSNVTWSSDTANKQRKTNVPRFATTVGNGHVKFLEFTNVFSLVLPYSPVFNGQPYSGVNLGVGDGIRDTWDLPSANVKQDTISMRLDGVLSSLFTLSNFQSNFRGSLPISGITGNAYKVCHPSPNLVAFSFYSSPGVLVYDLVGSNWVSRPPMLNLGQSNGVALTPDGLVVAFLEFNTSKIHVYDWNGSSWVARPSITTSSSYQKHIAISQDGLRVVTVGDGELVNSYDWGEAAWIKRTVPSGVGTIGQCVAITRDGLCFVVGGFNNTGAIYDWSGSAWIKRSSSGISMSSNVKGCSITNDGITIAFITNDSPYIYVYDWNGSSWVARATPSSLPSTYGNDISLSNDGFIIGVAHSSSPFISFYDWNGSAWIRRSNPSSLPAGGAASISMALDGLGAAVAYTNAPYGHVYKTSKNFTRVKFNTPPASGVTITTDYTVDGVHKTDQYVIDVSFAIQFGEGV